MIFVSDLLIFSEIKEHVLYIVSIVCCVHSGHWYIRGPQGTPVLLPIS